MALPERVAVVDHEAARVPHREAGAVLVESGEEDALRARALQSVQSPRPQTPIEAAGRAAGAWVRPTVGELVGAASER